MAAEDVERLRYFERQFLGATDFTDQQSYHRDVLRRHLLGHHTWGIVSGLELEEKPAASGANSVEVYIKPGIAIDGFGRAIVLLDEAQIPHDLFAAVARDSAGTGTWVPIYLRYREETTDQPADGYEQCDIADQSSRIRETYTIVIEPSLTGPDVTVAGQDVDPSTLVPDSSVAFQDLPQDDGPRWFVQLGCVRWLVSPGPGQPGDYFVKSSDQPNFTKARQHAGAVAEELLAPAGYLRIRDRGTATTHNDPTDLVTVEGKLGVDGLVTAHDSVLLDGGELRLDSQGGDGSKLGVLFRDAQELGLRLQLPQSTDANNRLAIGFKDTGTSGDKLGQADETLILRQ